MGVNVGWCVVGVGTHDIEEISPGEDRVQMINNIVTRRKQTEAQGDATARYLSFRFRTSPEEIYARNQSMQDEDLYRAGAGKLEDIVEEIEEKDAEKHADMRVTGAFEQYSSPNAPEVSGQSTDVETEKKVLQKIRELYMALLETKTENENLERDIDEMCHAQDIAKASWADRELRAQRELDHLRRIYVSEPNAHLSTPESQPNQHADAERVRRRKDYKPPKVKVSKKVERKKPFSPGISSGSHRFNKRESTSVIRIPKELLDLPIFGPDYPRPVFRMSLPTLTKCGR
uniref:Uncharacterized protein n=1 Tax=Lotharella globosa TaxID=91324 RepID=A0A7S3YPN5_9EUKA